MESSPPHPTPSLRPSTAQLRAEVMAVVINPKPQPHANYFPTETEMVFAVFPPFGMTCYTVLNNQYKLMT